MPTLWKTATPKPESVPGDAGDKKVWVLPACPPDGAPERQRDLCIGFSAEP